MGLLDLFGGASDPGALYGGLLSPQQNSALGYRGLLAAAGALGQAAMPSRMPIPIGAALGSAAGAMGQAQDTAALNAMRGSLLGLQGRQLESQLAMRNQLAGILPSLVGGNGGGAAATGGMLSSPAPNASVAPDLTVGSGNGIDPRNKIPVIRAAAAKYGIDPDVAVKVASTEGLGDFLGDNGKSGGAFQLYTGGGLGNEFEKDTGLNPLDPKNEDATIDYAMMKAAQGGWGPWNGAKRAGITGMMGIGKPPGTQVAQADTGTATDATPVGGYGPQAQGTYVPPGGSQMLDIATGKPANLNALASPASGLLPGGALTASAGPQSGLLSPQANQAPQTPSPAPAAPGAPGMGIGIPPTPPGINPRALAAAGVLAQLGGMSDAMKPLENYYYQSPGYLAQKAGAEHAGALPYIGPEAAAKAAATFPYEFQLGRSKFLTSRAGEAVYDPITHQEVFQTPTLQQTVNGDTGQKNFAYVAPGMNGAAPTVQQTGAISELGPGQKSALEASGKASVEANPNAFNVKPPIGSGPGIDKPMPMPDGSVVPPVAAAAPIVGGAKSVEDQQHDWNDRTKEWGEQQSALQTASQRTQMIAKAMQSYQTGAFANELSELRAGLKTVGINLPDAIAGNPAQAQIILKNAFKATLDTLQTAHLSKATQMEVRLSLENFANPNLQPEANQAILGQTLGQLQWEQAKIQGWASAKANGWRDPNDYERAWIQQPQNGIQGFVDRAEQAVGPLKGMAQPGPTPAAGLAPNIPFDATATGPNGHKIGRVQGQWYDAVTRQPVQ